MLFEHNTRFLLFKILITLLGSLVITTALLRLRTGCKKTLLTFAVYIALTTAVSFFIYRFWNWHTLACLCLLTAALPSIFVLNSISREPPMRLLFIWSSAVLISAYITGYSTLLNRLLHGNELTDSVLRLGMYGLCALLEFIFLRRPFLQAANTITTSWGILSLIPCSLTVFSIILGQYPENYTQNPDSVIPICFMGIVVAIIYFAIFHYLWTQYKYQMKEKNREILELQISNIRKNAADTKRKAEMAKMARQDAYALMSHITALAGEGNAKAILDLINQASDESTTAALNSYADDPILNATLNAYLGRAENSGITLETHLSFPKVLPVDSAEFSICLANALENAIKACEKLPKNERKILVRCICQPNLMFKIENTYKGKISFTRDGLPKTTLSGHGIGTRSVMAFCEKYNAVYSFKAEAGWFQVTVAL